MCHRQTPGDIELKVSGFVDQTIAHKPAEIFAGSGQIRSAGQLGPINKSRDMPSEVLSNAATNVLFLLLSSFQDGSRETHSRI